jgi:hypothetical protein
MKGQSFCMQHSAFIHTIFACIDQLLGWFCVLLYAGSAKILQGSYNAVPEDSKGAFPVIVFSHG